MRATSPSVDTFHIARRLRNVLEARFYDTVEELLDNPNVDESDPMRLSARIDKEHRSSTWTFAPTDIGYDLTLLRSITDGATLALVHGEQSGRYTSALIESGECEEYGYWDNTDPEDGVTDAQWEARRKAWGYALAHPVTGEVFGASPVEVGLSIPHPSSLMTFMEMHRRKGESSVK
jgi:hypothetical protein